ncbi:MAG: peroxiredoxin [Planctomycetota bacterium]
MALRLNDIAPDFVAQSTEGMISFHEWIGDNWCVLFSHPADFTPVCTTELGAASRLRSEFTRRGCRIIGLSVDPLEDHHAWAGDILQTQGVELNFPLIADADRAVSQAYGMIHPNADTAMTVRSVFIIGPDKRVKLTLTYPASTGRNFKELLRVLDSLQLTATRKLATPADWCPGDECVVLPSVSDAEANELFPAGYRSLTPYLRLTPQPS